MKAKRGRARFEHRHEPLLPRRAFYLRMARHVLVASAIVAASLGLGIVGYHVTAGLTWIDALVFITTIGIVLAPALHRLFHRFHIADEGNDS
jgi:hypothetical protein